MRRGAESRLMPGGQGRGIDGETRRERSRLLPARIYNGGSSRVVESMVVGAVGGLSADFVVGIVVAVVVVLFVVAVRVRLILSQVGGEYWRGRGGGRQGLAPNGHRWMLGPILQGCRLLEPLTIRGLKRD